MPGLCCVPLCNGRGGHIFPMNPALRAKWIHAIRRGEYKWRPTKYSTVCRAHFADTDYITKTKELDAAERKLLIDDTVPHIFAWTKPFKNSSKDRIARLSQRKQRHEGDEADRLQALHHIGAETDIEMIYSESRPIVTENENTDLEKKGTKEYVDLSTQTTFVTGATAQDHLFDSKRFHFYTGLENYKTFTSVFSTFGETVYELVYYNQDITPPQISPEDQFYLTLMKLRLGRCNYELSGLFCISERDVSNIFITWVNFLYFQFKDIDWWPCRELVKFFSPSDFRLKYPSTRVIVDGTEIPIKKPKQPILQQGTYSTYKNKNTVKALVGVTPGGMISYVSDVYGGSTSDRQICERSTLMSNCDPGDSIMADKGFNVDDLFIPYQVQVNIPQFFRKKNRMCGESVLKDRKIASKRVHVERVIGLAKTFQILKRPLDNTESGLSDAIISVCFYLCNFRPAIVPTNA